MNLLDEIRADLVNESASLSNTLRKAKILASQIDLPEFKEWLEYELSGYSDNAKVPEYRSFRPTNLGMFSGSFGSGIRNVVLPTYNLPTLVKEFAETLTLYDGVGALEGMLSQSSDPLQVRWPQEAVIRARDTLEMTGGMVLVDAHQSLPRYVITGILDNVKSKLLDFILGMRESNITMEDLDNRNVEPKVVRNLFNNYIYGGQNTIASGETVHQEVNVIIKGDVDSLIGHLGKLGIDDNDLIELKDAVIAEPAMRNSEFGPRVRGWLAGVIKKGSADIWKRGTDTALGMLMEALKNYYGN